MVSVQKLESAIRHVTVTLTVLLTFITIVNDIIILMYRSIVDIILVLLIQILCTSAIKTLRKRKTFDAMFYYVESLLCTSRRFVCSVGRRITNNRALHSRGSTFHGLQHFNVEIRFTKQNEIMYCY